MVEYKTVLLRCEECPYAKDETAYRKYLLGEDYQPEYCWCDKVGGKIVSFGFCSDAIYTGSRDLFNTSATPSATLFSTADSVKEQKHYRGHKNTGYSYRQLMKKKKLREHIQLYKYGYLISLGRYENGHIKLPRNSNTQQFYKRLSNKRVRQYKGEIPSGGTYKRFLDYWWTID